MSFDWRHGLGGGSARTCGTPLYFSQLLNIEG